MPATVRTVLITGAAKRVGKALALDLARHGWAVGIHYHGSDREAAAVAQEIEAQGGEAVTCRADLASEAETADLLPRCAEKFGAPVAALVNNASLFEPDEWDNATAESWNAHMQTNLRAPFILSQSLAKMLPAGQDGNIINLIDQRVWKLTPLFMSYTLSKSALWTLTRTLAQALAPRHIRVNAIGPGPVLQSVHQTEAQFARQTASVPLGHGPRVEEIAEAVRFLLANRSITGQMIALDGGQHLAWQTPDVVGLN